MPMQSAVPYQHESLLQRHPVAGYFALTYAISWTGAFAVAAPNLLRHEAVPKMSGLLIFPVMLLGPSVAGIVLTRILDGPRGLRDLRSRLFRFRFPARWYAALLIPPLLILAVLFCLKTFVSPVFAPNRFFIGMLFGVAAGFFEEIGWMGYALLWGVWHLPVIDYLGRATPHGAYWLRYFAAFAMAMTAMRVLIAWIYANTESVLLAQLLHVSSTGALVAFSPAGVTPGQEALWYAVYGIALWIAVAIVVKTYGTRLTRHS
jgi:uncharacterized protein